MPEISTQTRRLIISVAVILLAALLIIWGVRYLLVGQYMVETDDAAIAADTAMIAPKISGYVASVSVLENQPVQQGQLLATLDARDYATARNAAKADIAAAQAALAADQAQLSLQQAKIAAAQAHVSADQARLAFAGQNQRRYAAASASGAATKQLSAQAATDQATASAALAADQANLLAATKQVDVLNAQAAQASASLAQAQARAAQAELNLGHTRLTAPFNGVIGAKSVAPGDYLQPGTPIMAVVPLSEVYVEANYKETQLTRIQPGQPVKISVDAFPNLRLTGTVASIAPASGQQFALLPPDNATGNFTKIVQRVPVKILLNLSPASFGKLRPGMSVEPVIDTRPQAQH